MGQAANSVGIREAKNRFSELTARVNASGVPLTVLKNNRPWVVIEPVDVQAQERRERASRAHRLTAQFERDFADIDWGEASLKEDKALLGEERMRRFG